MPAYKDKKRGTWYFSFKHQDHLGKSKTIMRRGFERKKDAEQAERDMRISLVGSSDITFSDLVSRYLESKKDRVRESTLYKEEIMIKNHIRPFFGDMVISDITPALVLDWQNGILSKNYSPTYQRTLSNGLSLIFNYGVKFHGLSQNPIKITGHIGKEKAAEMNIWTPEQFDYFIKNNGREHHYNIVFSSLFWTGLRVGELLAIQKEDFNGKEFNVNKTFVYKKGGYYFNPPKTQKSKRVVPLPTFLATDIAKHQASFYELEKDNRIFPFTKATINYNFNQGIKKVGLNPIRIHDLRHSFASMHIKAGTNIVTISKLLGHESPDITLKIYSHITAEDFQESASTLDKIKQNI